MKPIANMAFYCCGVRMHDAERQEPVCGDVYAKLFMSEHGLRIYDTFKEEENANASIVVRHRIIDDILRGMLAAEAGMRIVTIGAGFDSRPYRLAGGTWIELDEPNVISHKNDCLSAASCANPLQRIAIDFCTDLLEEKLACITAVGHTAIVMEGVFMYLTESEIEKILATLHKLFPAHTLICDLVNHQMLENYGRTLNEKIQGLGACLKPSGHPASIFAINGYRAARTVSIVERSVDFGINRMPKFILRHFFNADLMDNSVYVFEPYDPCDDISI